MKCLNCGEDWGLQNGKLLKFCPGCGTAVATAGTGAATDNIIGRIIKQYGDAILLEQRKMLALVADMIANENPNQLRRIRFAIKEGVPGKIYELKSAREEERALRLLTIADTLVDVYDMKEEPVYEVINYFAAALGFETIRAAEVTAQQSAVAPPKEYKEIKNIGDIVRFGAYDWRVLDINYGEAVQ